MFVIGANIAECAPITTSYIWRARDTGAKLIVADPRVTPIARTADVFLGLRPGTDSALMGAMLHVVIAAGLARPRLHPRPHRGVRGGGRGGGDHTPAWAEGVTGVPAARIEQAAEWWGTARTGMLLHARGIEHHTKGVENVLACINLGLATGKYGKPGCGVTTITGQGNGQGGREHGHKCDQLPGNRDITNPEHRAYIAAVWGCDVDEIPGKGLTAQEIMEAIHRGEIKGLLSICFNPVVSLPDTAFTAEALDKLEFYAVIDFFLSETARHADVVLPGSLHEEDEGTSTTAEGRVIKLNPSKTPPGDARLDWEILCDLARRLGKGHVLPLTAYRGDVRGAAGGVQGRRRRLLRHHLGADRGRARRVLALPVRGPPGTPRLFEGGRFHTATAGPGSTRCGTGRRPRRSTTSTRCG